MLHSTYERRYPGFVDIHLQQNFLYGGYDLHYYFPDQSYIVWFPNVSIINAGSSIRRDMRGRGNSSFF